MPGSVNLDVYSHEISNQGTATQLTAGAVSTTAVGTIAGTTAAGAAPTVTIGDCTDRRGNFLLNPVTGGGAQAAGIVAVVRFAKPYGAAPGSVVITNATNETDDNTAVALGSTNITADGFDIVAGAVLVTAKAYRINYVVTP